MPDNSTIGSRLRDLRLQLGYRKQDDFARMIGVSLPMLSHYEQGRYEIKNEVLKKIYEVTGVNLHWLLLGEEPVFREQELADVVRIPLYDTQASAGLGLENALGEPQILETIPVRAADLRAYPATEVRGIRVSGDSMEPEYRNGDVVFFQMNGRREGDRDYVLRVNEHVMLKTLHFLPDGSLRIISRNRAYDPITIGADSQDNITVIGKAIGKLKID